MQCLYTISKKKSWMEFIMEFIKIKTSTIWIIDFWWKPDMSKVPKKGSLLKFLQYNKKKYCNCSFCVLFWCKTLRYFMGFQSCLLLLVFANIPIVPILLGQSRFLVCCSGVLDWISLYWFSIQFNYKQWETCSEAFFRTVFFKNIKTESNSRFLKYFIRVYQW